MSTKDTKNTDRPTKGTITTKIAAVAIAAAAALGVVAGAVGSSTNSVSTADHEAALASQHDDLMHRWAADVAQTYGPGPRLTDYLVYTPGEQYADASWRIDTTSIPGDADRTPAVPADLVNELDLGQIDGPYQFCMPGTHVDPRVKEATSMFPLTDTGFLSAPEGVSSGRLQRDEMPGGAAVDFWPMPRHLTRLAFNACLPDAQ